MFSDDDVKRCDALMSQPVQPTGTDDHRRATVRRIMERTAELLAARGGTMPADVLSASLRNVASAAHTWDVHRMERDRLAAHISAQGSRVAMLEDTLRQDDADDAAVASNILRQSEHIRTLEQHISDLEKSLENARKERDGLTVEAENLARNIAHLTRERDEALANVSRLRGVEAQAQVDAKFIHDALGWAGEWPRSLPIPSRAVVSMLERVKRLEALLDSLVDDLSKEGPGEGDDMAEPFWPESEDTMQRGPGVMLTGRTLRLAWDASRDDH